MTIDSTQPVPEHGENQMVYRMIELWRRALRIDDVAIDDDFFDLGGNSISAIRLIPLLREEFGVEPGILVLFDHPTPRLLSAALASQGARP